MGKKWLILVCFFSVLTLIVSLISASLVFFNEKGRTELNSERVLGTNNNYKSTSIIYNQNNTLKLSGLTPGSSILQSFLITNNNSNTIIYNIEWSNVTSTWKDKANEFSEAHPEELVYSLSCTNGEKIENKQMPIGNSDNIILENLELKTNQTNNCDIKVTFVYKEQDQSYNLNKSFGGTYKIVVKE